MAYGIRVSNDGIDVNTSPTSTNKKDFAFLSDDNAVKVVYADFFPATGSGFTYSHGLGKVPMCFLFIVDDVDTPTYFRATRGFAISSTEVSTSSNWDYYLIILNEGA